MAVLEPILLASPVKPVVSPATHRIIADILSDLTYNFGSDKGSEALVELWRKVKLPQEPDLVCGPGRTSTCDDELTCRGPLFRRTFRPLTRTTSTLAVWRPSTRTAYPRCLRLSTHRVAHRHQTVVCWASTTARSRRLYRIGDPVRCIWAAAPDMRTFRVMATICAD